MTLYDRFFLSILKLIFYAIKYFFIISWHGIRTVFTNRKKMIVLAIGTGILVGVNYLLSVLHISNGLLNGWWKTYLFVYIFLLNGGLWGRIKNSKYFMEKILFPAGKVHKISIYAMCSATP